MVCNQQRIVNDITESEKMPESPVVKSVKEKVGALIADNRKLRQELRKAMEQKDKLKAGNSELTAEIARLEKRIAVLELKEGMAGTGDNKLARARVNRLMREVDKCIALLNRDQA